MAARITTRFDVRRLAALLALHMAVADLSGRLRVIAEARAQGVEPRPRTGLSFSSLDLRGGALNISGAPPIFGESIDTPFTAFPPDERIAGARVDSAPQFFAAGGAGAEQRPLTGVRGSDEFADDVAVSFLPSRIEPKEALEFFRLRLAMTKVAFDKLLARYRAVAFTVATVESVALIETLQGVLDTVIAEGQTFEEFKRRADAAVRAAGVAPLKPFHLQTVFQTNVHSAYQAGRASMLLQADVRRALPWWQYKTVADGRVRPQHAKLHNFIARNNDLVWRRIFPPNDYNCRCTVVALTESQARDRGKVLRFDLSKAGRSRLPRGLKIGFTSSPVESLRERLGGAR